MPIPRKRASGAGGAGGRRRAGPRARCARCGRASRDRRPSRPAPRGCAARGAGRARAARCRRTSRRRGRREQARRARRARGLEAALRVAEAGAQHPVQDRVVGARDQLALGAAHHAGPMRQPRPDGEVAVAGEQRRDEREQAAQVGREVDVHVGDDARVGGAPGGAQRAAASLALEPQQLDAGQRVSEPRRDLRCGVRARVVGDHDPPGERELGARKRCRRRTLRSSASCSL